MHRALEYEWSTDLGIVVGVIARRKYGINEEEGREPTNLTSLSM